MTRVYEEDDANELEESSPDKTDSGFPSAAGGRTKDTKPAAKPEIDYDYAITYVNIVKERFHHAHPEIYQKFLMILKTFQKGQREAKDVLDEVSVLFADHADLRKQFTNFVPSDDLQS